MAAHPPRADLPIIAYYFAKEGKYETK